MLGGAGQGIRVVVGLKKAGDINEKFDGSQLLVSLLIGAIAGTLAAIPFLSKLDKLDYQTIIALLGAGYAGADFIEGFMSKALPGATNATTLSQAPPAQPTPPAPGFATSIPVPPINTVTASGLVAKPTFANLITTAPAGPLKKDGIPWEVQVDGADLVVRNIFATCFGGAYDSGDDGKTESGVMNDGSDPNLMGVALPIRSTEDATKNSPLAFSGPHIPWKTEVRVWKESAGEQSAVSCILIDNGPDVQRHPSHALDLNPNVVLKYYAPQFDPKKVADEWSAEGFSYRIVGGAKYIS
jgi:hypothetical protein